MPNAEIASTSASVRSTGPHHWGKMSVFLATPAPTGKIQENTKRIAAVKAKVRGQDSSVTDMIPLQVSGSLPRLICCYVHPGIRVLRLLAGHADARNGFLASGPFCCRPSSVGS